MPQDTSPPKDVILEVLAPYAAEKGVELQDSTELASDLDLDSMKTMDVLLELEERLDISIPLNILPNVQTLGDLARELDLLSA